jgi:hypothetical protein
MNLLKNNKILNIFIVGIIVFFVINFSKYYVIENDDTYAIFYEKGCNFFECVFLRAYKGKLLSNLIIKLTGGTIPFLLGIHPVIWIQTGGAFIKGIFYALFSFCIAKGMFFYKKINVFYPLTALICYLLVQNYLYGRYQNELYCSFYSFTFNMIFYFIFWQIFLKKYTENKPANFLFYIFSFFLGMTSEQNAVASLISLFLILIIELIKNKKLNTFVFKVFILSFLGFVFYLSNPIFIFDIKTKLTAGALNSSKLQLNEIYEGLKSVFLSDFTLYILLIVILFVIASKIYREEQERKYLLTILSMFIGGLIFYFLLILPKHEIENYLYIVHFDVILNIKILFLCIILLEIGLLFKNISFNLKNNIIIFSVLFFILIAELSVILILNPKNDVIYYQNRYLAERILAYYTYQNKIPVVFSKLGYYADGYYIRGLYQTDFSINDRIIKDDLNEVYKIYLKDGGCPILEEEIKRADFQKLLNKKFILECK